MLERFLGVVEQGSLLPKSEKAALQEMEEEIKQYFFVDCQVRFWGIAKSEKMQESTKMLISYLCYAVMPVNGDGASSLCTEYEQEMISPRRRCSGLLDALERNEKNSKEAEEDDDLSGEEKVMTMLQQINPK